MLSLALNVQLRFVQDRNTIRTKHLHTVKRYRCTSSTGNQTDWRNTTICVSLFGIHKFIISKNLNSFSQFLKLLSMLSLCSIRISNVTFLYQAILVYQQILNHNICWLSTISNRIESIESNIIYCLKYINNTTSTCMVDKSYTEHILEIFTHNCYSLKTNEVWFT